MKTFRNIQNMAMKSEIFHYEIDSSEIAISTIKSFPLGLGSLLFLEFLTHTTCICVLFSFCSLLRAQIYNILKTLPKIEKSSAQRRIDISSLQFGCWRNMCYSITNVQTSRSVLYVSTSLFISDRQTMTQ